MKTYKNVTSPLLIICPKHGEFQQVVRTHLQGSGCPKCIGKNKTTAEWIKEACKIHNNRYDYSKVKYKNTNTKVIIICPVHGEFLQTPSNHLSGFGCNQCGIKTTSSKTKLGYDGFLKKAKIKFGNKYSFLFDKTYESIFTKVMVVCKRHGKTERTIANILNSDSCCSKCGWEITKIKLSSNTQEFIKKSNIIHNNRYDYSKVKYKNTNTKVIIICPIHGEFEQLPNTHLAGKGCNICGIERSSLKQKMSIDEFIERANKNHSIKYDYSKIVHNGWDNKIIIICPIHGDFEQSFGSHLQGKNCPKCQASKNEEQIRLWLEKNKIYFIEQAQTNKYFKNSLFILGIQKTLYDFLLFKHKIIIEYDGEHHFKIISRSRNNNKNYNNFLNGTKRDEMKDKLAIANGYKILRIPFWEKDNINKILENLLIKKDTKIYDEYNLKQNQFKYEMMYKIGLKNENNWEKYFESRKDDEDL